MGAVAGAFAAAATTPLDVIKTNMMCSAASRPTMLGAARAIAAEGSGAQFFRCGPPLDLPLELSQSARLVHRYESELRIERIICPLVIARWPYAPGASCFSAA